MVIFHFQGPLPTTDAGHKYVLTITDYYTKFVDFYPLKEKAAIGVARRIKTYFQVPSNTFYMSKV